MKTILCVLLVLNLCRISEAREFRDLTNTEGVTIRAEWHELLIRTEGDTATVSVDGEEVGTLQSEGIAHATKSLVSLTTNINDVHYDDFSVKAASDSGEADGKKSE